MLDRFEMAQGLVNMTRSLERNRDDRRGMVKRFIDEVAEPAMHAFMQALIYFEMPREISVERLSDTAVALVIHEPGQRTGFVLVVSAEVLPTGQTFATPEERSTGKSWTPYLGYERHVLGMERSAIEQLCFYAYRDFAHQVIDRQV